MLTYQVRKTGCVCLIEEFLIFWNDLVEVGLAFLQGTVPDWSKNDRRIVNESTDGKFSLLIGGTEDAARGRNTHISPIITVCAEEAKRTAGIPGITWTIER
jgi:hypothetical protein